MKKLKKFVLNNAKVLSSEELAAIEGGLTLNVADNCTPHNRGEACVFASSYTYGHQTITIGTCTVIYVQQGASVVATGYCS